MAPTSPCAAVQAHPRYAPAGALTASESTLLEALKGGPKPTDELIQAIGIMNISQVAKRINSKLEAQGSPTRVTCTLGAILNRQGKRVRVGFWSVVGEF